jgi:hypothetical protein
LWTSGLDGALARFNALLEKVGTHRMRPDGVSRVDTAFDFKLDKPDFQTEHFVSQAAKDSTWREHGTPQSFQFGKGDVVCRVYDKIAEIAQQSEKDWMFPIWGTQEGVHRCEFQVRTERLKQAGISTVDQLRAYLPSLIRELAKHHTSLRVPNGDSNKSRWPCHPMWQGMIAAADQLTTAPDRPPQPLLVGTEYQVSRQTLSILGNLKGLAAALSMHRKTDPLPLDELLRRLPRLFDPYHSPELWRADVLEKVRKRELGL